MTDKPANPDPDAALMLRVKQGDTNAFAELVEKYKQPLFNFIYRTLRDETETEDVAQNVFLQVYKSRARYERTAKFSTWLFTIAANLARNHFRWRSRHPNLSLDAENPETERSLGSTLPSNSPNPNEAALAEERVSAIQLAVKNLPADLREAIVLCEWEECSVAEAAAILEATPKAVESRLYRARQILRERLQSWL